MNINESRDDDERYYLTTSRSSDKMADPNNTSVVAASTIMAAAAVRRRRRRKRSRWVRDWYLCSSMVTYYLDSMIRKFIEIFAEWIRLNIMNVWHLLPDNFRLCRRSVHTAVTESMEFDTFDFVTKVEHVQLVQLCRKQ